MTHAELVGSTDDLDRMRSLVGELRSRPPGGLREVLGPVLAERDRLLAGQISAAGAALLRDYDRLLLMALSQRYDALDRAVRDTSFAIAEIDGEGTISYANKVLTDMLPHAVGTDFAALFGPRAQDVRNALSSGTRETLRLDLDSGNETMVHLRGEISPLSDERDRSGAYALLLGLDGEMARLHALPDGVVRIDPTGNIADVNPRAEKIFGLSAEELRGRPAGSIFLRPGSGGTPLPIDEWLAATDGHKVRAEVPDPRHGGTATVRLAVTPYFDSAQSRSGVLVTIFPMGRELVRRELQEALSDPHTDPERLVRRVMQAVKRIIPYDLATFGIYTDDLNYHKTLVVDPKPNWEWLTAWFPISEGAKQVLHSERIWGDDLQQAAAKLAPELIDDPVMQRVIEAGMKGYVTLTIGGGGERIRASLTLLSKQPKCYDGQEVDAMRSLGVESALLVAEANVARRRVEFARRLEEDLVAAQGYRELAEALARGISKYLGWEYVAVYALDRAAEQFRMIAQHNASGSPTLDGTRGQPFTEGMLGATLRANRPQFEPDIRPGKTQTYKPAIPRCRSAATLPLRVIRRRAEPAADEIEWILAIESSQGNAFQGPNMHSLANALEKCEHILGRRWNMSLQTSLLEAVEQALVFVDRAGRIRLINPRANTLFGGRGDLIFGETLAKYGASAADKNMLKDSTVRSKDRLILRVSGNVTVPTLASQCPVDDDYGHRLWMFTDLREQQVQKDWAYLEQTVNEVARNARLPLMTAEHLVENAAHDAGGDPAKMLDTALRHLAKADITYERLINTFSARQDPDWPAQTFDACQVLREAVCGLPEDDLQCCEMGDLGRAPQFLVLGWADQLRFAFRSVLAYLLLRCPYNAKVKIAADAADDSWLKIAFSLPIGTAAVQDAKSVHDGIATAKQRASEAASLASESVELVMRRHGGEFVPDHRGGKLMFRFALPRNHASAE
jgi:PAS domain S-box-containing protein